MIVLWRVSFLTFFVFAILLGGCKSLESAKKLSREATTIVELKIDDVILSPGISREVVSSVANRIQKYTLKRLDQQGIKTARVQDNVQDAAKLIVEITALEVKAEGKSSAFPFGESTVRMDLMVLKFNVTILSQKGEKLLSYDEYKWKESLDDLAQIIAKDATKSLLRCYR